MLLLLLLLLGLLSLLLLLLRLGLLRLLGLALHRHRRRHQHTSVASWHDHHGLMRAVRHHLHDHLRLRLRLLGPGLRKQWVATVRHGELLLHGNLGVQRVAAGSRGHILLLHGHLGEKGVAATGNGRLLLVLLLGHVRHRLAAVQWLSGGGRGDRLRLSSKPGRLRARTCMETGTFRSFLSALSKYERAREVRKQHQKDTRDAPLSDAPGP